MKRTTKTRERERERERESSLNEFVEEFPYFEKSPRFVEPKRQKKSSSLGKDILIIFWRIGGKNITKQ